MSMNLNCRQLKLWQTPSQITYMCMAQPYSEPAWDVSGDEAQRALAIYRQWVKYSTNGTWHSDEALNARREAVREHLAQIDEVAKDKNLQLFIM